MKIFLIILLVIAVLYFLLLYAVFRAAFSTKGHHVYDPMELPRNPQYDPLRPQMTKLVETALKVPFEEVHTESFDGLSLYGRVYPGDPGNPVEIMFHGWKSNAVRDFAGGAAVGREARDTVLLIDERGTGGSEGDMLTYGILERRDVLSWIDYVNKRWNDPPILLYGISMGAATVLMSLDQPLPPNVLGVIADSPYTAPKAIICKVARDMHLPAGATWFLVRQAAFAFGHFNPEESDACTAVRGSNLPVLLLHGDADQFVPVEMSREIADAAGGRVERGTKGEADRHAGCEAAGASGESVELEIFHGAPHGVSFLIDEPRYRKAIGDFRERCLARKHF